MLTETHLPPDDFPVSELPQNAQPYLRLGLLTLFGGVGLFLLWAALAPLDKGVVSPGIVMVSGYRKVVQAPVSGSIETISVRDGQQVKSGETLMTLVQTQALAQLSAIREQYALSLIIQQRLLAEREHHSLMARPSAAVLTDEIAQSINVAEIMKQQQHLLWSRRQSLESETQLYQQSVTGIQQQIAALDKVRSSKITGLAYLARQIKDLQALVKDGFFPRNRYLELQRQAAATESDIAATEERIRELHRQRQENQQHIVLREAEYQKDVDTQLEQLRIEISESSKKLKLATFSLAQTRVTAPQDGIVIGLNTTTRGGVVSAGEHLMDVVPQKAAMIVDAELKVGMIDKVHQGMPVTLSFTAFNHVTTPRIPGQVTLVSADRLINPRDSTPFYKVQIAVTPEGMSLLHNAEIKPGMPVEVFIKSGERSLLNYLFKPFQDRLNGAFTEE
ncbi:HlyD family type I secretion periplasmic adaptor subunit [Erwinia mallotivora]|uniref:HlyD family type I secretion periplasmic adaptor subunit n=1 Tax=Erwinia mallotivora TaxID=69222 RepID=UPI0004B0877E|nr:HlyD family type I secretion periplasmic adaptor subunit [Erwinia mallotivora]